MKRYYDQDTWKENLIFKKDSFELLQDILEDAGELGERAEYEELVGITFDKIVSLTALGLIETDLAAVSAGYKMEIDPLPNKIIYYDMEKELKDKRDLQVGNVLFTKAGQALYWAIDAEKVEGFWENYCIPFWEK